jgi:hypothetical protein
MTSLGRTAANANNGPARRISLADAERAEFIVYSGSPHHHCPHGRATAGPLRPYARS